MAQMQITFYMRCDKSNSRWGKKPLNHNVNWTKYRSQLPIRNWGFQWSSFFKSTRDRWSPMLFANFGIACFLAILEQHAHRSNTPNYRKLMTDNASLVVLSWLWYRTPLYFYLVFSIFYLRLCYPSCWLLFTVASSAIFG